MSNDTNRRNVVAEFSNLLPDVFADNAEAHAASDVWLREGLTVSRGDRLLIRAASGSGKTSLCAFITGTRSDYHGTIRLNGEDIQHFSAAQWASVRTRRVAWLPQDIGLFPTLTAMENIELKNSLTDTYSRTEIMEMLRRLGMEDHASRPAGKLSWGQQQRVGAVRALCQPFDLLLLDEPVSHLDPEWARAVGELIEETALGRNAAVITTSVGTDLTLPGQRILNL